MVDILKQNWYNNYIIGALYMTAFFMIFLSKKRRIFAQCLLLCQNLIETESN